MGINILQLVPADLASETNFMMMTVEVVNVQCIFHCTGGSELNRECREYVQQHGNLSCGEVFTSRPGKLPCKVVVHTVGPVWHDGKRDEEKELERAVHGALKACRDYKTVALPAVSCGIYGFPVDLAAKITIRKIRDFMTTDSSLSRVDIVVTKKDVISEFHRALVTTFGADKVSDLNQTLVSSAADSGCTYFPANKCSLRCFEFALLKRQYDKEMNIRTRQPKPDQ